MAVQDVDRQWQRSGWHCENGLVFDRGATDRGEGAELEGHGAWGDHALSDHSGDEVLNGVLDEALNDLG